MLVKDIVYYILDSVKGISDDLIVTEDHIVFLMKKYRSFLIKKEIDKEKESSEDTVSEFDYQEICLDLEKVSAIDGYPCEEGYYLRSTKALPKILEGTTPQIYFADFFSDVHISYVPRNRIRYVGTNKFLRNIIYVGIGPDLHLYLKSSNP